MLSGMLRILVVGLVLLVAIFVALPRRSEPVEAATVFPEALPVPEFALAGPGGTFTRDDLRGRFTWMFFGFTHCPDICPITLKVLADARAELVARNAALVPEVVFVSVDPGRDSPERIAAYLASFDPAFRGVTGSEAALAPLLGALGVAAEKHTHGGESYSVIHNPHVYLIGPDAAWIAVSGTPHVATTLASDYLKIRRLYRPQA
jgi:protein SCO1/2